MSSDKGLKHIKSKNKKSITTVLAYKLFSFLEHVIHTCYITKQQILE